MFGTNRRKRALFYYTVASLLESGNPLVTSIKMVSEKYGGEWRKGLENLACDLEGGEDLSSALRYASKRLKIPELEVAYVDAMEQLGSLDSGLYKLAELLGGKYVRKPVTPTLPTAVIL